MTWIFSGILFICPLVVSFAALALRARAAHDTTRAQIFPQKVMLFPYCPDVRCLDSNSRIVVFSNAKDNLKDVQFSFNYQLNFSFLFFRKSAAYFRGIQCLCWSKFDAVMFSKRLSFRFRVLVQSGWKQQGKRPIPLPECILHHYHGDSRWQGDIFVFVCGMGNLGNKEILFG